MVRITFLLTFGLPLLEFASGKASKPPFLVNKQLAVQGGAGPIDPKVSAKVLSGLYAAQGLVTILSQIIITVVSPRYYDGYVRLWGRTPLITFYTECLGLHILASGIIGGCLMFTNTSVNAAVGSAQAVIALALICAILNVSTEALTGVGPFVFCLLCQAVGAFAALAGKESNWANKYLEGCAWFDVINGAYGIFQPNKLAPMWGIKSSDDTANKSAFLLKSIMHWMLTHAVMRVALFRGVEPAKAIGYGSLVGLTWFTSMNFVTKEVAKFGLKQGLNLFWNALFAVLCASILL